MRFGVLPIACRRTALVANIIAGARLRKRGVKTASIPVAAVEAATRLRAASVAAIIQSSACIAWNLFFQARCGLAYSGANVTLLSEMLKFPHLVAAKLEAHGSGRLNRAESLGTSGQDMQLLCIARNALDGGHRKVARLSKALRDSNALFFRLCKHIQTYKLQGKEWSCWDKKLDEKVPGSPFHSVSLRSAN